MKKMMIRTAAVILGVGLLAGCASSDRLTKMEADIANAQAAADAALKAANTAQDTADSAMSAANAAQAAADECSERCSRMSEKAFAK